MVTRETHWDLKPGDRVWVNGSGPGVVAKLVEDQGYPLADRVTVKITRQCRCDCGHRHQSTKTVHVHPMHVTKSP